MKRSTSSFINLLALLLAWLCIATHSFGLTSFTMRHIPCSTTSLMSSPQSGTTVYAGAGISKVDMTRYNVPLETAVEQLTAVLQSASSMMEAGVFLGVKNTQELFLDTITFKIKRQGGLGLVLTEIAGGREDGLGITIVEEILEGSNSEHSGIIPGDSIIKLAVDKQQKTSLESMQMTVSEERIEVATECLGFDKTIEVLTSLPSPTSSTDEIFVTVKRVRRQPKVTVKVQFPPSQNEPDVSIELFAGENLRRAMLTRGIKLNDKLAQRFDSGGMGDCGAEGTCATCVVSVTNGLNLLSPMKQQESQILAKKPRWRMACKTIVGYGMEEGNLTIQVNPKQWV